jgi:hypothetical protein
MEECVEASPALPKSGVFRGHQPCDREQRCWKDGWNINNVVVLVLVFSLELGGAAAKRQRRTTTNQVGLLDCCSSSNIPQIKNPSDRE